MPKSGIAIVALATVGVYVATGDPGVTMTFPFAAVALWRGRGLWLKHLLAISWTASAILSLTNSIMATVVLGYTLMDLTIAAAALVVVMQNPLRRDARLIGGLSMALMPAHWIMSASQGHASWLLYASILNAVYAVQCITIAGGLDGVGIRLRDFFARFRPTPVLRRED